MNPIQSKNVGIKPSQVRIYSQYYPNTLSSPIKVAQKKRGTLTLPIMHFINTRFAFPRNSKQKQIYGSATNAKPTHLNTFAGHIPSIETPVQIQIQFTIILFPHAVF